MTDLDTLLDLHRTHECDGDWPGACNGDPCGLKGRCPSCYDMGPCTTSVLLDDLAAELQTLRQQHASALALHQRLPFDDDPAESYCDRCQRTAGVWPCATARALGVTYEVKAT